MEGAAQGECRFLRVAAAEAEAGEGCLAAFLRVAAAAADEEEEEEE